MRLAWVEIENYRQFRKSERLEVDDWLTVVAGANNSGKTSVLELLNNILGSKEGDNSQKSTFRPEDVPTANVNAWLARIVPEFMEVLAKNDVDAENFPGRVKERISKKPEMDRIKNEFLLPSLDLKFCVKYEQRENEEVQKFAAYYMDLDEKKRQFFFHYKLVLNEVRYFKELKKQFDRMKRRYDSIVDAINDKKDCHDREEAFKQVLLNVYFSCLEEKIWYCNEDFTLQESMEKKELRPLFHLKFIQAARRLDDVGNDKSFTLSKEMIGVLEKSENWNALMGSLPDKVLGKIEDDNVKQTVYDQSIKEMEETVNQILDSNGGKEIKPDILLDMKEEHIKELLGNVLAAKYKVDDSYLGEASQGLGLSNLIYLHLQIQKFMKEYDPQKVNLFFLEEPEAHMHPQMQQVFMKYLLELKHDKTPMLQGIMTTHSAEMVAVSGFSPLRVIRVGEEKESRIVDLSSLDKEYYDLFFEIGYSEIVFADKVVFYEGDTERMYLRKLMQQDEFKELGRQYVAFVQVGGAYAHNYKDILDKLEIKALILTDIDYKKDALTKAEIENSITTNATIKKLYKDVYKKEPDKISDLYKMKMNGKNIIKQRIYLAFQGERDGYTRTLEEAMLCKKYGISVWDTKEKKEWERLREEDDLSFSVPEKYEETVVKAGKTKKEKKSYQPDSKLTVREILRATSGKKTDFMYSVLLKNREKEMLPDYISEGLKWLNEK